MSTKPLLTVRCPQDLMDEIVKRQTETGKDKTAVVLDILADGLKSISYNERNTLPESPCVYLVYDRKTLLYIGVSVNLRQRFTVGKHHRASQFSDTARIAWFDYEPDILREMEQSLIELLTPELNGTPIPPEGRGRSPLISFRVSGEFLEWLEAQRQETESLNLTAQRLLKALSTDQQPAITPEILARFEALEERLGKLRT